MDTIIHNKNEYYVEDIGENILIKQNEKNNENEKGLIYKSINQIVI